MMAPGVSAIMLPASPARAAGEAGMYEWIYSDGAYVRRLRALLTLRDIELNRLILLQVAGTGRKTGNVDKDVCSPFLRNEAVALLRREPLDCS